MTQCFVQKNLNYNYYEEFNEFVGSTTDDCEVCRVASQRYPVAALSRYAIGYILRGTKYIYDGDKRQTLSRGDVFYLGIGHHYIENFPEGGQPFEQVLFITRPATCNAS